jgi:hypothetical protein
MGNTSSSRVNEAEQQAFSERVDREIAETQRKEAEAAAAAAEADRKRQEEEKRKRDEEEANRLRTIEDFKKPFPPTLALTNKTSFMTKGSIEIQAGLSSSTVILSRDILGKTPIAYLQPPGSLNANDVSVEKWKNYNFLMPTSGYTNLGDVIGLADTVLLAVTSKYPDRDFPDVWVKGKPSGSMTKGAWYQIFMQQSGELEENMGKFKNQNTPYADKKVLLWNPADKAGNKSAVAINYKTHGALTKVFLKPTIPFTITYNTLQTLSEQPSQVQVPKNTNLFNFVAPPPPASK